jgi:hypothetical protein
LTKKRALDTGITSTPATIEDLHRPVDIVPLAWEDHLTFTYRLVKDAPLVLTIANEVRRARRPHPKHVIHVGDIVVAPHHDAHFRAKVRDIDSTTSMCSVFYLDYATVSPLNIPLAELKVLFRGRDKNILAQWPPLARRARHAFLQIPPVAAPPTAEEDCVDASTFAPSQCALYALLIKKMELLVSLPQLAMYVAYVKDGVDHVLLKPANEPLGSLHHNVFELDMWKDIVALQKHTTPPFPQGAEQSSAQQKRGESVLAGNNKRRAQQQQQRGTDIDRGCVEFPVLVQMVAQFLETKEDVLHSKA